MARFMTTGAVCAATLSLCASVYAQPAFDDCEEQTRSFSNRTDWNTMLNFNQFDTMGGTRTLVLVEVEYSNAVVGEFQLESTNAEPAVVTVTLGADVDLTGPNGSIAMTSPSDDEVFNATAYDGVTDFAGTSGIRTTGFGGPLPSLGDVVVGVVSYTGGDLAPFVGNGTFDIDASATASSTATGAGNLVTQFQTDAGTEVTVRFCYTQDTPMCIPADREPNDVCEEATIFDYEICGPYIEGKLEKREAEGCEPDTFLVLFDKDEQIINSDDNGAIDKGNGWGSGLYGVDFTNAFIDNGDGSFSLRMGVTGRPDGLDGDFNGFFQNAPHGQLGGFTVQVTFYDGGGQVLVPAILPNNLGTLENPFIYEGEFKSGADAFRINLTVPLGAATADICIDNTTGRDTVCRDVDFYCIEGLVPLCDYCITQVGGLDYDCNPTNIRLGWFDKSCDLIVSAADNGPAPGFAELCVPADVNGKIILGVTGAPDGDFNGIADNLEVPDLDPRAPQVCPEPLGHGVCGCYTLCIRVVGPHGDTGGGNTGTGDAAMLDALEHGDLNMDGVTDPSDLSLLLGNFGWVAPN